MRDGDFPVVFPYPPRRVAFIHSHGNQSSCPGKVMRALPPVIAVGGGAFAPAGVAILSEVAPEDLRGTTMGIYDFSISIGMTLGPVCGGIVKDLFGYRVLFLSCSLLVSIALLVLVTFMREP